MAKKSYGGKDGFQYIDYYDNHIQKLLPKRFRQSCRPVNEILFDTQTFAGMLFC